MGAKSSEQVIAAATVAAFEMTAIADEIEAILEHSLPRNASAALRTHLATAAARLQGAGAALRSELDRIDADPESVRSLARVGKRACQLLLSGTIGAALVGGALEGVSATATEHLLARSDRLVQEVTLLEEDLPSSRSIDVVLTHDGGQKIQTIRIVREQTGLALKEAKDLVEGLPAVVLSDVSIEAAEDAARAFAEVGALVDLRPADEGASSPVP